MNSSVLSTFLLRVSFGFPGVLLFVLEETSFGDSSPSCEFSLSVFVLFALLWRRFSAGCVVL